MTGTAEKKKRRKPGPVRAFVVSDPDREESHVEYAESAGQARARAPLDFTDFTERVVKRAPELDQYLAQGGPTKADLLEHGWWFECQYEDKENHRGCFERVTKETGGVHNGEPLCQYHLALAKGADIEGITGKLLAFINHGDTLPRPDERGPWKRDDYLWADVERREQFIKALESRFGITIPDEDAVEAVGNKVADLAGYIGLRMLAAVQQTDTPTIQGG